MSHMSRKEGHLILAGIRVLVHGLERAPTPEELADLLGMASSSVRLQISTLANMGAVALVESAFETHVEVRDHLVVDELPEGEGPAISEDLKAFDEKRRQENERMSHLFETGEQAAEQKERHEKMDEELQSFRNRKTINPFGED